MDGFSSYHNNSNASEPDFNMLTQIGSSIQKISQNVSSMQRMVQHLGTTQDSREFRAQLEQIQQYTQQLAKDTSSNLKEVNSSSNASLTTSEQRQWKAQRDRLADEFTTALNAFQAVQRMVASKQRDQIQKSRAQHMGDHLMGPPSSKNHQNQQSLIELTDDSSQMSSAEKARQMRQKQQQMQQDELDLELLEEQERSIRRLESDINDVNQIFKELGSLVHDQAELVDSIEASVERTEVFVHEGTQQLRQASSYQTKLRKKKFILAMIAAAVLAIIIGIIAWQTSS